MEEDRDSHSGRKNGVENGTKSVPPSPKVEDIFQSLGGYSTYQRWLTFILIFPQFATSMIILSANFTGSDKVLMYCKREDELKEHCGVNCTFVDNLKDVTYSSIVQEWDLFCSHFADTVQSFQMAGMTTGAIVSSIFSDQYGRRKCFLFQTLCMGLLGMLPAIAFSPWTYAVARFLSGFGVGACFVVYLSHLMEFLTPSWRTICGTISFWPLGEMLLGLLAYLIGSWRWLTVTTALPALVLVPFYFMVLESPRWLLIQRRTSEAHQVFATVAKWNGNKPAPSLKQVEDLQAQIIKEEADSVSGMKAIFSVLSNNRLRLHMLILIMCNITCSIVYYGVSFDGKNLSGDPYWNMFYMGLFDLFGSPAAIPFNNWIGRRKTFIMYMSLGTAFILALLVLDWTVGLEVASPLLVTILTLSGRFGIVAAWGALTCLILETAPTNLRSTCSGFAAFLGYFGGILAPQLFLLRTVAPSLPYIILCILTTFCSISSWFIRETLERPLEDTVE